MPENNITLIITMETLLLFFFSRNGKYNIDTIIIMYAVFLFT